MAERPRDVVLSFLQQYYETKPLHGQSFYSLNSKATLYFRYSKLHPKKNAGGTYFFGVESDDLAAYATDNAFLLFICGGPNKVIVLPFEDFMGMVARAQPVSDQWKILVREDRGKWYLRVAGKGQYEVSGFLNFYHFTHKDLRREELPEVGGFIPLGKRSVKQETPPPLVQEDLASLLLQSARDSEHPAVFEKNVTRVFVELGLDAERLGGPGSTDVLIKEPFRAIVDCKSSASGSLSQVNFTRIKRHRSRHEADFAAVVSENFDPAVVQDAGMEDVALMKTATLAELLSLNLRFPIGPEQLRILFEASGIVEDRTLAPINSYVSNMNTRTERIARVLGTLDSRERTAEEIKGRLEGTTGQQYELAELTRILTFLADPLLDVVDASPGKAYRLKLPPSLAKRRIKAMLSALKDEARIAG